MDEIFIFVNECLFFLLYLIHDKENINVHTWSNSSLQVVFSFNFTRP